MLSYRSLVQSLRSMVQDAKITTLASGKQLFIDITEGPSSDAPTIFCASKRAIRPCWGGSESYAL